MTTASEISFVGDGRVTSDVLLLGAAGSSGQLIAAELAARGLSLRLSGRRLGPLEDLARVLAAGGAATEVRTVDASDVASLAEAIPGAGVVLSTIGPFTRQAGPVIDACLAAGVSYVEANEWSAVRGRPRRRPGRAMGDKAYSSAANRSYLRRRGIQAVIPVKEDQNNHRRARGRRGGRPPAFDPGQYRQRNTVERCFSKRKQFRAVATRHDKRECIYQGPRTWHR